MVQKKNTFSDKKGRNTYHNKLHQPQEHQSENQIEESQLIMIMKNS